MAAIKSMYNNILLIICVWIIQFVVYQCTIAFFQFSLLIWFN